MRRTRTSGSIRFRPRASRLQQSCCRWRARLRLHAERAITLLAQARAAGKLENPEALDALELGARRIDFIGLKFQAARRLREALRAGAGHRRRQEPLERSVRDALHHRLQQRAPRRHSRRLHAAARSSSARRGCATTGRTGLPINMAALRSRHGDVDRSQPACWQNVIQPVVGARIRCPRQAKSVCLRLLLQQKNKDRNQPCISNAATAPFMQFRGILDGIPQTERGLPRSTTGPFLFSGASS